MPEDRVSRGTAPTEREPRLIGRSRALEDVRGLIATAAPTSVPVLIVGETGTGKEVVARMLHAASPRAAGPFVAVNCAALPDTLLESELFGHERGAFTGAWAQRAGCFELADGGTLLLDEMAAMSAAIQPKLLRALETGVVRRVGGSHEVRVDVRVLGTMNKSPEVAVRTGLIREDLYYRLNVFSIVLPPLRSRREDVLPLTEAFLAEFNLKYGKKVRGVAADALKLLLAHPWPGNVRQLRNSIEWAILNCGGDAVIPSCLPPEIRSADATVPAPARDDDSDCLHVPVGTRLQDCERELILRTIAWTNQNKTRAAKTLRISAKTLHDKLRRYAAVTAAGRSS